MRLVCDCQRNEACHGDVLLLCIRALDNEGKLRSFSPEQQLVLLHLRHVDLNGADLRVDAGGDASARTWPRREIDIDLWTWRVVVRMRWRHEHHINILEGRAALAMLRWRTRSSRRLGCLFLRLMDSFVNIAALAKHRSSAHSLALVVRPFSALELASGSRALFGFTSSARNPADAPSRWE